MPKIAANGIDFYYERHGKGDPIILICGFINTVKMWAKMIPELKKHFEVILFDHRGIGRTQSSFPPYTIDLLADDVVSLMNALKIPKAHVMGWSMGAAIAQTLGLRHGERLLKGILLAPFSTLPNTAIMATKTMGKLIKYGINPSLAFETVFPWLFSSAFLTNSKQVKQTLFDIVNAPFPPSEEGYAGQLEALLEFDLTDRLSEIQTHMLMIFGEQDLLTPLDCAKILEEKLPNSTLRSIPEVGHMIPIEKSQTIVEETIAFCKSE